MIDITGTPQHTIAKICVAERLTKELEQSYNNIISVKEIIEPLIINLKEISKTYRQADPEILKVKTKDFAQNIHKYVPNFSIKTSGINTGENSTINTFGGPIAISSGIVASEDDDKGFTDHIKDIISESYEFFHEDSELLQLLEIDAFEDIGNMTSLSRNFVEALSSTIMSASFGSAFLDYDLDEMNVGALLSVTEHNLFGAANIADNLANVTDIAENLITNFADVADLGFVNGLLTNLPSTLGDLFIDKFGNLNIAGLLDMVGLGAINEIWSTVQGLYDTITGLTDMLTGGFAGLLGGLGSCACAMLLSVNSIGGTLRNIANFARRMGSFVGQINSTIQNVRGLVDNIDGMLHGELVNNIDSLIDQIRDPEVAWDQIQGILTS